MIQAEETKREVKIDYQKDDTINKIGNYRKMSAKRNKKNEQMYYGPPNQQPVKGKNARLKQKDLKNLIKKQKVEILKKNFCYKIGLNGSQREPVDNLEQMGNSVEKNQFSMNSLKKFKNTNGLKIGNIVLTIWTVTNILHSVLMVFIYSIMMAFPATIKNSLFWDLRLCSMGFYLVDIILNCVVERYEKGKLLKNLQQIASFYLENHAAVDIISLIVFSLDLLLKVNITVLTTLVAIVRFMNSRKKVDKLEYLYIDSSEKEQYYGLVKVFLTNFAIGHVLSILLNLMAGLSQHQNWWMKIDIVKADWLTKYIWGYYWGTNIMLTVGFGDLAASNEYEAIILVFIETFSCITLAYNISYVGALISQINEKDEEKKKRLKFFYKMCSENKISEELESKIANYIQQSYQIKQAFCYDEYDEVIDSLPRDMQVEYRKQSNKIVFDGLGFLTNLSKNSLLNMAEYIERKICHPNEYVARKGDKPEFTILQKGKLCFTCKNNCDDSKLNGKTIQTLSVGEGQGSKMISLDFIKNKPLNYDIKSEGYTILYILPLEKFKQSLKNSDMDYQLYCLLRDRSECILDAENIYLCQVCLNRYHNKFQCSRLHYIPLKQMVIYKKIRKIKDRKSRRSFFVRQKPYISSLQQNIDIQNDNTLFTQEFFGKREKKLRKRVITQLADIGQNHSIAKTLIGGNKINGMTKVFDQLERIINQNILETNFWDIECDIASNFFFYFKHSNPENLNKTSLNFKKQHLNKAKKR